MKHQFSVFFCLIFTFFIQTILFAQNSEQNNQELLQIEQRAKEIEPFLDSEGTTLGVSLTDRNVWDHLASFPESQKLINAAKKLQKTPIPETSEALYKEYYQNGNRSNYQRIYGQQRSRLSIFALAEALENQGNFLPALEETIRFLCEQPSWLLPAHDRNAEIYDGKTIYSDLVSTNLGCEMGIIHSLFKNSFSKEINELIINNIEERVLVPYEKTVKKEANSRMWWVKTTNNWNSVCHAGTVGAALTICSSPERRAWFIAASEYYTKKYFFAGFSEDGYCSEGMSYWNYGFGHFIYLAAMIRQATHHQVDLFQIPKVVPVTCFAPNLEIADHCFAAFADCPINARPNDFYVGYLSRMFQLGFEDYESRGLAASSMMSDLMFAVSIGFDILKFDELKESEPTALSSVLKNDSLTPAFSLPIRSEFETAGVWILRPFPNNSQNRFALALKGGSNSEHHNHNDVGTYSLVLIPESCSDENSSSDKPNISKQSSKTIPQQSSFMVIDPGAEIYTARTFGTRRYEGQLLNSFGHPVPRVNHQLQKTGADAKGIVIEKSMSDQCDQLVIDISSAYNVPELDSLRRTFVYRRDFFPDIDQNVSNSNNADLNHNSLNESEKEDQNKETQTAINQQTNQTPIQISEESENKSNQFEQASVIISDSVQFKQDQPGIFESAIISFEPYEIESQDSGIILLKKAPLTILVRAVDDQKNNLPLKWEKAIVGENDDSVPKKPTRYGFQIDQNVQKAQIDFLFILDESTND